MSEKRRYPQALQQIVDEFNSAPKPLRLALLLDYAKRLPALPAEYAGTLEKVHECQTPLFLRAKVEDDGGALLLFDAPQEAPTTRGFASVISQGLNGVKVEDVLAVPDDFYQDLGLGELISPLRLRGMGAIVTRAKRQLAESARTT